MNWWTSGRILEVKELGNSFIYLVKNDYTGQTEWVKEEDLVKATEQ